MFRTFAILFATLGISEHTLLAQQTAAQQTAAQPPATSTTIVLGPQFVNQNNLGRGEARFKEFRDIPQGFTFEFARFLWTPADGHMVFSATARDVGQKDQRYAGELTKPGRFRLQLSFVEVPRFYSTGSKALWTGVGTGALTLSESFRQGAEQAAGDPNAPFASSAIASYIGSAIAASPGIDLQTQRKDFAGGLDFHLAGGLTLNVSADIGTRTGTRPLGFGTYIRRQGLTGVAGTGAGSFWRETIEPRGNELVEPLDHRVTEGGVTVTWAKKGHTVSGGWFGSAFRNATSALFFDNPFEASPGRASATAFTPASDQEPAAPLGNNNLRGLYARSALQLAPDNDFHRIFGNASVKLPSNTRVSAVVARGMYRQDDPFLPYAENDQVVFSQPGAPVVYARNMALPQASLNGRRNTTQVDLKLTTRRGIVSPRIGWRYYDLNDDRPTILFPGYSSAGDSYFRRSISQTLDGQKALFNVVGGHTRRRLDAGMAVKLKAIMLDGEYIRTGIDYEAREVKGTTDNTAKGAVRFLVGGANVNAFYLHSSRDYNGTYNVGLETSGVRAFDVWTRDRNQTGADVDLGLTDRLSLVFGASYWKDDYPGAVPGFTYAYGRQDGSNGSLHGGLTWAHDEWLASATAGYDAYNLNNLQVTKTSQGADYNPTDRWTRESSDNVFSVGFEAAAPVAKSVTLHADENWQRFDGRWTTANVATPDVNSAVAYPVRAALVWAATPRISVEGRYWFEPYRLNDFTLDMMQPYMQGIFKETRSSASDIGDMNVSRFLFLDSRYSNYTAHVVSALVHFRF